MAESGHHAAADNAARPAEAQRRELAQDQKTGRRALTGLRLWYLGIMPLGLISTALVHAIHPLWPYPAAWWASGPAAALLALRVCQRESRQAAGQMPGSLGRRLNIKVPMVIYTGQTIADVSGIISVILLIASAATIAAYSGSPAGSAHAQDTARAWHYLVGVLPALALCITIRVILSRMRRRGQGHAAAA